MHYFDLSLLVSAGITITLGSYVFLKNPLPLLNRLFFLISIGITYNSVTEFSFRQAETTEIASYLVETTFLWGFTIALLLHFILVFTEKAHLFRNIGMYVLVYFPAGMIAIIELTTDWITSNPIRTEWGWTYEVSENSLMLYFASIWALSIIIVSIILTLQFYFRQEDDVKRKRSKFVVLGLPLPIIAGALFEWLIVPYLTIPIPNFTTVAHAVGYIITIYAIQKYQLFVLTPSTVTDKILETMSDFLILVTPDGIIQQVNLITLNSLGYKELELIGFHLSKILINVNTTTKLVTGTEPRILDVQTTFNNVEIALLTKIGEKIPVLLSSSIIYDSDRKLQGIVYLGHDITQQKDMEITRQDLENKRSDFIEVTSHELRTPLTLIRGYSEFLELRLDELPLEMKVKCFKAINKNIQRLEHLITGVSTLGQLERGAFHLNVEDINFNAFLNKSIEPYTLILGSQLEFTPYKSKESIIVEGDPTRLLQVIDNLIENSINNSNPIERKINVVLEICPLVLKVHVTDNGVGITPEDLQIIFEQFISIPTDYSAGGSGIGLFLSRMIIEAHNGTITAHSLGKNQGSTFIVELPRKTTVD